MHTRVLLVSLLCFYNFVAFGQVPQNISIQEGGTSGTQRGVLACPDQFAGTVTFSGFVGASNDITRDTLFLCFGDQIDIKHKGDQNLTGDPNPGTQPGITYGFFNCKPTISGPNRTTVLTNPCIIKNPAPVNGIWVTGGGTANGNITFVNDGTLQSFYNSGKPMLIWFAPLTIDDFGLKKYENDPGTGENGPCVNLNVNDAFAVVYLNEIKITNLDTNAGSSGCLGSFNVTGGLPQFDSSLYKISIVNIVNNSITGQIVSSPATHGDKVSFRVPIPGIYRILIEDGKSCPATLTANMNTCVTLSQSIQNVTSAPNDIVCLNVTNEGGFNNIVSMQYVLTWNGNVVEFAGVNNLTKLLPGFDTTSFSAKNLKDSLILSWFNLAGTGVTLPQGTVLYQLCFRAKGNNGDCSSIRFTEMPVSPKIEIYNSGGNQLGFNGVNGQVCISASALQITMVQDSVKCPGAADGSLRITVSGGKAPYKLSWRNTAGGAIQGPGTINIEGGSLFLPNLTAGTYSVTVTDDQGIPLISTREAKVLSPPILTILLTENAPKCNGQLGSITSTLVLDTVVVSNPLATYNYLWSSGATGQSISNVPAGNYSLMVTDKVTGCKTTTGTVLPQPPPLIVNIGIDTASCSGKEDGNIRVNVFGGTPDANQDYSIQWPTVGPPPGIQITSNTFSLNGRPSRLYPLRVIDSNGCIEQRDIFLPAKKVLSINTVITKVNCVNDCSGSIFASGTTAGGVAALPYNFQWFGIPPPPPPTSQTPNSITFNGLCPGIYVISMQDTLGCKVDTTVLIVSPPQLVAAISNLVDESCAPGMNGSISVSTTGGTKPYKYNWSNSKTDSVITGLSAGPYTVIVSDSLGCADTLLANITTPQPPVIQTLNDNTVACSDSKNGILQVIAAAGSVPITAYIWSNGATGATASGLSVGKYFVSVSDSNGCITVDSAEVRSAPSMIVNNIQKTSPICPGLGGGSISLSVGGGTGPYFFQWSTGLGGNGFNVLGGIKAGNYTVTITDDNGCKLTPPQITLDDPAAIAINFTALDSVDCFSGAQSCNGGATATGSYSNGNSGNFNFKWQSGETRNNATTSSAVQLCKGTQWLVVSDGICFDTFRVNIPAPAPIIPSQVIANASCNGHADGSITLNPSGGNAPYNISWAGGQLGPKITGLSAGNYTALISDSKNCIFTHTITITQPEPLDVFINGPGTMDVSCPGDKNGSIAVAAQGGNISLGGLQYVWKNGIAPANSTSAKGLAPGIYSVSVVDQKGCVDSLTHTVKEPPPIRFSLGKITPIQCYGGNTFVTIDSIWGGRPSIYQYSVNNGINRNPGAPSALFAGQHLITVVDVVNLCSKDSTIIIKEPLELSIQLPKKLEIQLGDTLTRLIPTIISSVPIDSFRWSPATQLSCTTCKNPLVNAVKSQLYTLTITDANGCRTSAQVLVDVDKKRNVFIPNAFSPNDDGINDKFIIYTGLGVTRVNFFRIYDRWGEMMFEVSDQPPSADGSLGWDGRFNNQKMKPGVFLYLVEVQYLDGQKLLYRGDLTLLR